MKAKARILIVDDVRINLQLAKAILSKNPDLEIEVAASGQEGLEIVKKQKFDLILLDVMMPGMNGYEVCTRLKADPETSDIPVVFLTAQADTESVVIGLNSGASDYLTKPFNSTELQARVKNHLKLRFYEQELRNTIHKLQNAQEEILALERKNSVLAMAVTANHELNQPLTVLKGNLYFINKTLENSDSCLDTNQKEAFEQINEAVSDMQRILKKYLITESIRFDNYSASSKMVIFENDPPDKKHPAS